MDERLIEFTKDHEERQKRHKSELDEKQTEWERLRSEKDAVSAILNRSIALIPHE